MIANLIDLLFGCSHGKTTVPIFDRVTYVACLDCGAEFAYDWKRMRRGPRIHRRPLVPDVVAVARAEHDAELRVMREEIVKE